MKYFFGWFFFVSFLGLFAGWIGGIEPFTEDAGGWAAVTFLSAVIVGAVAAMADTDDKRRYPEWYKK